MSQEVQDSQEPEEPEVLEEALEEVLEALEEVPEEAPEAAVLPEEEVLLLETLEEEVRQVPEPEKLEAAEEKETLEVVGVNNALDNTTSPF